MLVVVTSGSDRIETGVPEDPGRGLTEWNPLSLAALSAGLVDRLRSSDDGEGDDLPTIESIEKPIFGLMMAVGVVAAFTGDDEDCFSFDVFMLLNSAGLKWCMKIEEEEGGAVE